MSGQLPYPLPGGWTDAGPYRNPGQTVPFPAPQDMPVGLWRGERVVVDGWTANPPDDANVLWRLDWASPIFDLRPDLRSVSDNRSNTNSFSGVPVWNANSWSSGVHLWLWTQAIGSNAPFIDQPDMRGLEVLYQEESNVIDLSQIGTTSDFQDVTAEFTNGGNSIITAYNPWGAGNPVRYWRLRLRFQIRDNSTFVGPTPPRIVMQGAMY